LLILFYLSDSTPPFNVTITTTGCKKAKKTKQLCE
jgi:hypothetical protein